MRGIKKKLILISLLLVSSISHAQEGCIEDGYEKIEHISFKTLQDSLEIKLKVSNSDTLEIEESVYKNDLRVRIYGTYIMQDYIELSSKASLLEYTGFTLLNVVGGKRILSIQKSRKYLILRIEL